MRDTFSAHKSGDLCVNEQFTFLSIKTVFFERPLISSFNIHALILRFRFLVPQGSRETLHEGWAKNITDETKKKQSGTNNNKI